MSAIGIYGGSFNPPHVGHVRALGAARQLLDLDRVLVIPAATPPHKPLAAGSPEPETRLELTRLAFQAAPWAEVLDLELRREGKSYTSDTLRELSRAYPGEKLYLIMGTDMFLTLHTWHEPEVICALSTPVCMHRSPGDGLEALQAQAALLKERFGCEALLPDNPVTELSSTTVRRFLALGAGQSLVPGAVYDLIRAKKLYDTALPLTGLSYEALEQEALKRYREKRIPHALGCVQAAQALARRWGVDVEKARRAAILHDVTKALKGPEQLGLAGDYGLSLDPFERDHPTLLHAVTGAEAARVVFGEPEEVYSAIRWHTTGRPGMTGLEKIIYLADYIEPNRSFDGLDEVRQAAGEDLDGALILAMEGSLEDLARRGIDPSPLTGQAISALRLERNTL